MKFRDNTRILLFAIAAGAGLFVGGKWNGPAAAWLAPILFIRFFRTSEKPGRDFVLAWVVVAIATAVSWRGATAMHAIHPIAEPVFFLLTTPLALVPYLIDRSYHRRFPNSVWVTLVFPTAYAAVDFFSASGSPFGTFGAGAYSQRDFLAVMQIAAVTGIWGIVFLVGWSASVVNYIWERGFRLDRFAIGFACSVTLILGLGFARSQHESPEARPANITGFSLPNGLLPDLLRQIGSGDEAASRPAVDRLHAQLLGQIRTYAQAGADIVVLQEGAGLGFSDQVDKLVHDASALAKTAAIYIVLPTFDAGKTPPENVVHIIDPSGASVLTHVKFGGNQFEGTRKGDGLLQTVDTPYGRLSAVICWDADFPGVIAQAGRHDVDLLFVPANDWLEVKDIHAGMATFRAVENGMSLFRQTGQGVSLATDAYGRTLSRVDSFDAGGGPFAGYQAISLPIASTVTWYPSIRDGFGYTTLIGLGGLLIGLFVARRSRSRRL